MLRKNAINNNNQFMLRGVEVEKIVITKQQPLLKNKYHTWKIKYVGEWNNLMMYFFISENLVQLRKWFEYNGTKRNGIWRLVFLAHVTHTFTLWIKIRFEYIHIFDKFDFFFISCLWIVVNQLKLSTTKVCFSSRLFIRKQHAVNHWWSFWKTLQNAPKF